MTEGALVVAMPGLFTIVEQSEHLYDHVAATWPQPWYGHNLDCAKVLYCNPESAGLGARYSLSAANAIAEGNGERPVGDGDCRCPECRPDLEAARIQARVARGAEAIRAAGIVVTDEMQERATGVIVTDEMQELWQRSSPENRRSLIEYLEQAAAQDRAPELPPDVEPPDDDLPF